MKQHRSTDYKFSPDRDPKYVLTVASEQPEVLSEQTRERDIEAFDQLIANRPLSRPGKATVQERKP